MYDSQEMSVFDKEEIQCQVNRRRVGVVSPGPLFLSSQRKKSLRNHPKCSLRLNVAVINVIHSAVDTKCCH